MDTIGLLMCGRPLQEGTAKVALDQLNSSIKNFATRSVNFLNAPNNEETLNFGPFCARALLENSCAALVGRLDAFRLIYLAEFQAQPEYDAGKRAKSSFAWSGDVIPDHLPAALWNVDSDAVKISRALLSKHVEHLYWRPAVEKAVDFCAGLPTDPALAEIAALDPEVFVDRQRGFGARLYSNLSKGVHWEFFSAASLFDEVTVKSLIRDTCNFVSQLGLISHFIPTAHAPLPPQEAFDYYIAFRRALT